MSVRVVGVSPPQRDALPRHPHGRRRAAARRQGQPRARPAALAVGTAARAARPVPSGVYVVQVRGPRPRRQRRLQPGAGAVRPRRLARPGRHHRALAGRAAAAAPGHRGRAGGLLRRLARAALPLGDPARGRQEAGAPRQGRRGRRGPAEAARPRRRVGALPGRAPGGPQPHRGAVPRAGARARDDARRRPGDHLARHGPGRRPAVARRDARHAEPRRGGRVRWPRVFAGEDGRPAGFGSVAALVRYLDRNKIRYDLTSDLDLALSRRPARERPQGRAARGQPALGHAAAGAAPQTLRAGRRPPRDLRARDAAPGRHAARGRRRDRRRAAAPHRSRARRTRSARGWTRPPRGRRAAAHPARRRSCLRPVRGHGRDADGLQRVRGVRPAARRAARRRCSARWASSRRSPIRTRPPTSRRRRRATR